MSGASEHTYYMKEGSVVSINVGLPKAAINGKKWRNTHRVKLLEIFVTALQGAWDVIGMLVSEVGTADKPYGVRERMIFDGLLKEAFHVADEGRGASEHSGIQISGRTGEPLKR